MSDERVYVSSSPAGQRVPEVRTPAACKPDAAGVHVVHHLEPLLLEVAQRAGWPVVAVPAVHQHQAPHAAAPLALEPHEVVPPRQRHRRVAPEVERQRRHAAVRRGVAVAGREPRLRLGALGAREPRRVHGARERLDHPRVRLAGQHGERRARVHHHPTVPGAVHAPELRAGRDPRRAHRDRLQRHRVEVRVPRVVEQRRVHEAAAAARLGGAEAGGVIRAPAEDEGAGPDEPVGAEGVGHEAVGEPAGERRRELRRQRERAAPEPGHPDGLGERRVRAREGEVLHGHGRGHPDAPPPEVRHEAAVPVRVVERRARVCRRAAGGRLDVLERAPRRGAEVGGWRRGVRRRAERRRAGDAPRVGRRREGRGVAARRRGLALAEHASEGRAGEPDEVAAGVEEEGHRGRGGRRPHGQGQRVVAARGERERELAVVPGGWRLRAPARAVAAVARGRAEGGGADEVVDGDWEGRGAVGPAERAEGVGERDEQGVALLLEEEVEGEQSGQAEEAHGTALSRSKPSGFWAWQMAMVLSWGFGLLLARGRTGVLKRRDGAARLGPGGELVNLRAWGKSVRGRCVHGGHAAAAAASWRMAIGTERSGRRRGMPDLEARCLVPRRRGVAVPKAQSAKRNAGVILLWRPA
ncbi:hypothetical protein SETIT_7G181100v2 [Setaria italica]|uniref:Uncharacterized protein n=1 Tax=Setaria italica TaxID=4555 RepID=A0A368RWZ2_SETIT|nr:hypothetical protein SETIT_7G181100v2 [Setaria italica]